MGGPHGVDYKFAGGAPPQTGFPPQTGYAPQPGFAPYHGHPSNNLPPSDLHVPNNTDNEPMVKGFEFSTESIRRGFIRKVYAILSVKRINYLKILQIYLFHVFFFKESQPLMNFKQFSTF